MKVAASKWAPIQVQPTPTGAHRLCNWFMGQIFYTLLQSMLRRVEVVESVRKVRNWNT